MTRGTPMIRTSFLLGALLAAGAAQAQVHKCVDTGGKTVYSQVPCPKASKATTLQRTAPAVPQAPAAMGDAKAKQENCRNARLSLANLESGARQSRTNEKGERYFLDDGQIASEKD